MLHSFFITYLSRSPVTSPSQKIHEFRGRSFIAVAVGGILPDSSLSLKLLPLYYFT
jgi:hypothetical protein